MTYSEHRPIEPSDYSRLLAEFQAPGLRDLINPFSDVDRQLLDEMLAHSLVDARPRFWSRRRTAMAAAGVMATLMLTVWIA